MSYTRRLSRGMISSSSGTGRGPVSVSGPTDSGYDHALDGKYERYSRTWSSAAASSGATLWTRPLGTATDGPPSESLSISSPVASFTTGGPAVKIDAVSVITDEVGDPGDERAVPGGGAEHRRHHGHVPGAPRLHLQVDG